MCGSREEGCMVKTEHFDASSLKRQFNHEAHEEREEEQKVALRISVTLLVSVKLYANP